jgi:hypothetical protein
VCQKEPKALKRLGVCLDKTARMPVEVKAQRKAHQVIEGGCAEPTLKTLVSGCKGIGLDLLDQPAQTRHRDVSHRGRGGEVGGSHLKRVDRALEREGRKGLQTAAQDRKYDSQKKPQPH